MPQKYSEIQIRFLKGLREEEIGNGWKPIRDRFNKEFQESRTIEGLRNKYYTVRREEKARIQEALPSANGLPDTTTYKIQPLDHQQQPPSTLYKQPYCYRQPHCEQPYCYQIPQQPYPQVVTMYHILFRGALN